MKSQATSIIEAVHKSVGQVICTLVYLHNLHSWLQANALVHIASATNMHATGATTHQSLHYLSPLALAFCHDMHLDIPLLSNIITLQQHHQALVDHYLLKQNTSHISHDYTIGELVLKWNAVSHSNKLLPTFDGPFEVLQVHMNGTCTIHLAPNITECINICSLKLYQVPGDPTHGKGE